MEDWELTRWWREGGTLSSRPLAPTSELLLSLLGPGCFDEPDEFVLTPRSEPAAGFAS